MSLRAVLDGRKRPRPEPAAASSAADEESAANNNNAAPPAGKGKSKSAERKRKRDASAAAAAAEMAAQRQAESDEEEGERGDDGGGGGGRASSSCSSSTPAMLEREVYMEGIPYTATEADIHMFLQSCGAVLSLRAPTFQDTGRLRGYAHVTFSTKAAAAKALALDGRYMGERFISVQAARPVSEGKNASLALSTRQRPAGCHTVFVKGLPYDADEATVKGAFSRHGAVVSVRLPRWQHTGRLKGNGYVQFQVPFSADAAMKEYRTLAATSLPLIVCGRRVDLDWETGIPRQSYKNEEGKVFFKTEEAEVVKKAALKSKKRRAAEEEQAAAAAGKKGSKADGGRRPRGAAAAAASSSGRPGDDDGDSDDDADR